MDLQELEKEMDDEINPNIEPESAEDQKRRAGFRLDAKGNLRVETRVSRYIREALEPLAKQHIMGQELVKAAEDIGLVEAFKWLSQEELVKHEITAIIWVTPSEKLLQKCARWYIGPQVLLRGAAIKMASKLEADRLKKVVRGE